MPRRSSKPNGPPSQDITLAVDQAFYQALTAQSVLKVAQQTVATRQATGEQIGALTKPNCARLSTSASPTSRSRRRSCCVLDAQNAQADCDGQV